MQNRDRSGQDPAPKGPAEDTHRFLTADRLQFLQTVVNQSIDGIAVADMGGTLVFCNQAFAEIHGYDPQEVLGKHLEIFHAPEQMFMVDQANRLLAREGILEIDLGHVHRDGTRFIARMRNTLLRDDEGEPIGLIGTLRPLAEADLMRAQLVAQRDLGIALGGAGSLEETLKLCLETAMYVSGMEGGGVYLVDKDSGGVKLVYQLGLPDDFAEAAGHFDAESENVQLLRRGQAFYTHHNDLPETTYGVAPEREQFGAIAVVPLFHQNSLVGSLNLASRTMETAPEQMRPALESIASRIGGAIVRARMEQRLKESEARFRTLFHSSTNAIGLMRAIRDDDENTIDFTALEMNKAMRRQMDQLGLSLDDCRLSEALPAESLTVLKRVFKTTVQTGEPLVFDRYSALWRRHYIVAAFAPTPDQLGLIFTDITALKETEAELRRHQELLEERVAERTNELELVNDELRRLNSDLGRSNAELEQFAYVASHDLQAPLRHIAGFLKLLEQRLDGKLHDPEAEEFLQRSVAAAERLRQMIRDLLTLSRVESHALPPEAVSLDSALDNAIENLNGGPDSDALTVTRTELPVVKVERSQLVRLLQNLLSNAIKFAGDDPPRVAINAVQRDAMWEITVQDSGIGMDQKQAKRVFGIFARLHTREQYPGTGIGLAICKKVVERHGGRIWLHSSEGEGATIHFTLPHG